jgi:hypothetical protein
MRFTRIPPHALFCAIGLSLITGCGAATTTPSAPNAMLAPQSIASNSGIFDAKKCGPTTGGIKVLPCSVIFKTKKSTQVTVSGPPSAELFAVAAKPCKGIATFKYFDYGIYTVVPGKTTGSCNVVFTAETDNKKAIGTAQLAVTNNS